MSWIPTTERLPGVSKRQSPDAQGVTYFDGRLWQSGRVLAWDGSTAFIARFTLAGWEHEDGREIWFNNYGDVTHWMPLTGPEREV